MTTSHKVFSSVLISLFGFISVLAVIAIFEMVRPYSINTIKSFTVPTTMTRGQLNTYVIESTKHMNINGSMELYVEDGSVYQLFSKDVGASKGDNHIVQDFIIPSFVTAGPGYRLHAVFTYHPNTFRTVEINAYSNSFILK